MKYIYIIISLFFSLVLQGQDLEKIGKTFENKNPFNVNGSISFTGLASSINGLENRTSPWAYSAAARVNFSVYGINVPVYFAYRNHNYNYGSALPKLRINPKYKWAELQIGDVYNKWNPYVLSQRSIRGLGIKLTPGKFRFQAIKGKIRDLNTIRDTLQIGFTENETYTRGVQGALLGFGTRKSYVDLMVLQVKDDDIATLPSGVKRQDNVIGGLSTRLKLGRRITFQSNLGLSVLTYDRDAIGETYSIGQGSFAEDIIEVNSSTNANYAGDVSIDYNTAKYGVNIKTKYIQAFYQPLTIAYINTDQIDYTVGGRLSLFKNKLALNGSIGFQNNNLSNLDAFTTHRQIYNITARYLISKNLSATILSNNFTQNLEAQSITINNLVTYSVNNALHTAIVGYNKADKEQAWNVNFSLGRNKFTTIVETEGNFNQYTGQFIRGSTSWKDLQTFWKFGFSIFKNDYDQANASNSTYGIRLSADKSIWDQKLNLGLQTNFNYVDENGYREGKNLSFNLISNYAVNENSTVVFSLMYIDRNSVAYRDFQEWRSRLSIRYKF